MNKKGFTLVELLAVIVLLAIIALIATPIVLNTIEKAKKSSEVVAASFYVEAVDVSLLNSQLDKKLVQDGSYNIMSDGNICLEKYELKSGKYVCSNNDDIDDNEVLVVEVEKEKPKGGTVKIINGKIKDVRLEINKSVVVKNHNGELAILYKEDDDISAPDLLNNTLTPVVYKDGKWKVADVTKEWYNYNNQEWANAVILKDGLEKEVGDEITINGFNSDALAMFVWIPRYSYTIRDPWGIKLTGGGALSKSTPGAIDIKFVDKSVKENGPATYSGTKEKNWLTHPAFTFDNEELSGIWVGKFELSHETKSSSTTLDNLGCTTETCTSADGLRILPNVKSLRYNSISRFHFAIRSMERNDNGFNIDGGITDTHMIKNDEWGAVAYLSQSKYGKYGNSDYEGANKQIYINNINTYTTGISGGAPALSQITSGGYSYDVEINGTGASTTGNIYGVYDMSGGAWDYVFGVMMLEDGSKWTGGYNSTTGAIEYSGFSGKLGMSGTNVSGLNWPNSKYYNTYTLYESPVSDTDIFIKGTNACNRGICYGHALSETAGWYNNAPRYASTQFPWMRKGCNFYDGKSSGVFCFAVNGGNPAGNASTRVIMVASTK